ncbi:hypothetical protein HK105_200646 [Polyrhizophydium stewartii]|uniref:Alkaline phosphatase n=1 Tax=Polyrhizophydium stewartii TaxID=2732419 RepID=A0ABR4NJM0_9FUNG
MHHDGHVLACASPQQRTTPLEHRGQEQTVVRRLHHSSRPTVAESLHSAIPDGWVPLLAVLVALNVAFLASVGFEYFLPPAGPAQDSLLATLGVAVGLISLPPPSANLARASPLVGASPPAARAGPMPVPDLRLASQQIPLVRSPSTSHLIEFRHGIASGDPLSDSIILWTKISPPVHALGERFAVRFQLSTDLANPASFDIHGPHLHEGLVETDASIDFVVKVDAKGLPPNTRFMYRFVVQNAGSPHSPSISATGFTRTLPSSTDDLSSLRMAVVSCSNLVDGFFNAYANIARRSEIDIVLHLGDYIYEYADGEFGSGKAIDRIPVPNKALKTLDDYRTRHAQYKLDPDLQAAHQFHPWIVVWDDHEFADNIDAREQWREHTAAGMQAYFEYLPIREARIDDGFKIYRSFKFGNLIDLVMLDTRIIGRDETDVRDSARLNDPKRSILGAEQEAWLEARLVESQARNAAWRFVGNQVVFSPLKVLETPLSVDSWDGYPANRDRIISSMERWGIRDTVFLTGDIHSSFAFDIVADPFDESQYSRSNGTGSIGVELVSPSVTSRSALEYLQLGVLRTPAQQFFKMYEPHLHYVNLCEHGYILVHVTRSRVTAEYWYAVDVQQSMLSERLGARVITDHGANRITHAEVF